jgi:hypothetical protein
MVGHSEKARSWIPLLNSRPPGQETRYQKIGRSASSCEEAQPRWGQSVCIEYSHRPVDISSRPLSPLRSTFSATSSSPLSLSPFILLHGN